MRFLPDIDLDESGPTTCCDDFRNDGLSLALATTTDDDFGTCFTKSEDTSFADTAGRSDDEDDFVFEGFHEDVDGVWFVVSALFCVTLPFMPHHQTAAQYPVACVAMLLRHS